MTTLIQVGRRVFNAANIQEIDLAYSPRRHDKNKPPSDADGVQVILLSGHQLPPFWDAEAQVLRDFLAGHECDVRRSTRFGLTVLTLSPEGSETAEEVMPYTWDGEPVSPEFMRAKAAEINSCPRAESSWPHGKSWCCTRPPARCGCGCTATTRIPTWTWRSRPRPACDWRSGRCPRRSGPCRWASGRSESRRMHGRE